MELSAEIQACREGRHAAQQRLFNRYGERMFALCYRYVKNKEDAEELMLNGFLNFFKTIHRFSFTGEASLSAWIRKIMVNECLMFLRKKGRLRMVSLSDGPDLFVNAEIIGRLTAEEIYQLILELPVGYRTVFNLYVIEGMSHRQIAAVLKISEGTSKSQLSKARGLLQRMVEHNRVIREKTNH